MKTVERHVKLLRMSENLVIEGEKAKIRKRWCGEDSKVRVLNKFRRWEREAKNS